MTGRIILLHGWTMRGRSMAPLAQALPGFHCVAPDLPGHGAVGFSPDVPGAVAMLDDLLADGPPCVLVGWSLGALVGWRWLAGQGTGPVRGMVSLDMSPRPMPAPGWAFGMTGQTAKALRAKAAWFRADWAAAAGPIAAGIPARPDSPLVPQARAMIAAQDGAAMAACWSSLIEQDCREDVARLAVPLLAIHGAASRVYSPSCAAWLAAVAPQGAAQIIPDAGHAPHLERTVETAAAIAAFARQVLS